MLKGEADHDINRLFVIEFPNRSGKDRFFKDSRYLEIRARLFTPAVKAATIIGEHG
jgi:hypothetical protein